MSGYKCDLFNRKTRLEKSARGLVPQIVEVQVLDAQCCAGPGKGCAGGLAGALLGRDADWLWFMTWHTRWLMDPGQNDPARLKAYYGDARYLTKDELPGRGDRAVALVKPQVQSGALVSHGVDRRNDRGGSDQPDRAADLEGLMR